MDYTAVTPITLSRDVTIDDIRGFFVGMPYFMSPLSET